MYYNLGICDKILLDITAIEKIDTRKMYEIYDKWPEIAKECYSKEFKPVIHDEITHLVFCGMGGSGALGDIFAAILSNSKIHVSLVKGYTLPKTADEKTLVITTSISGNTIETLSVLNEAKKIGCKIIAFTSGGKMEEYCLENKVEYRKIPFYHSPRASFVSFLYSMLKILDSLLPINNNEIIESIRQLKIMQNKISSSKLNNSNQALELGKWITGIPLIYYPFGLQAAAIRFKNCLQENSKIHAICEDIIEACHNGIVSWEKPSIVQPILIKGKDDHEKTKERWDIIEEIFDQKSINFKAIITIEGGILSKIITLIYLFDYASIYKSVLDEIDPSPVNLIDFIKKKNKEYN